MHIVKKHTIMINKRKDSRYTVNDEKTFNTLCEKIREVRKFNKLSLSKLADIMNVAKTTIISWEVKKRVPSSILLAKFCSKLNVSADYMLGNDNISLSPKEKWLIKTYNKKKDIQNVVDSVLKTYKQN